MSLARLPNELLLIIAHDLAAHDLAHLLSTNRRLSHLLTPELHKHARLPKNSLPALHWAVHRDHVPLVKLLLSGADAAELIDSTCSTHWTALRWAAAEGRPHMVQLLLENGASPTLRCPIGETALLAAAKFGTKRLPPYITPPTSPATAGVNNNNNNNSNNNDHQSIVRLLLEHGADKDSACAFGRTPLHWAASRCNVDIVRTLLAAGADVNITTRDRDTPLMWAITSRVKDPPGKLEIMSLLLEHGADVTARNNTGGTALQVAAGNACLGAVSLLLRRGGGAAGVGVGVGVGVGLEIRDAMGRTALHHSVIGEGRLTEAEAGLGSGISMLIEAGADVEAVDVNGDTPLHFAVRGRNVASIRTLLEKGAGWRRRNGEGFTVEDEVGRGTYPSRMYKLIFVEEQKRRGEIEEEGG